MRVNVRRNFDVTALMAAASQAGRPQALNLKLSAAEGMQVSGLPADTLQGCACKSWQFLQETSRKVLAPAHRAKQSQQSLLPGQADLRCEWRAYEGVQFGVCCALWARCPELCNLMPNHRRRAKPACSTPWLALWSLNGRARPSSPLPMLHCRHALGRRKAVVFQEPISCKRACAQRNSPGSNCGCPCADVVGHLGEARSHWVLGGHASSAC